MFILFLYILLLGERERDHLVVQLRCFFHLWRKYRRRFRERRRTRIYNIYPFSPIFQYFSTINVTPVYFFPIFRKLYVCHAMCHGSSPLDSLGLNSSAMDSCAMDSSALNSSAMDSSAIFYTTSQVLIVYCHDSYKQNPNKCIVHVLCRCCCTCSKSA